MQQLKFWLSSLVLACLLACSKQPGQTSSYKTALVPIVVFESDEKKAEAAIRAGADVNALEEGNRAPLMYAAGLHISNSDRQMMKEGKQQLSVENVSLVKLLLDHGANPNAVSSGGDTALSVAVYHGRQKTIRVLLENGADPNLATGPSNWTPLMLASYHCFDDLIALLRQHRADVSLKSNSGETAADVARRAECPVTTQALLK